jgi:hypothetical protein
MPVGLCLHLSKRMKSMSRSNRRKPEPMAEAQWYLRLFFSLALALGIVRVILMFWSEP